MNLVWCCQLAEMGKTTTLGRCTSTGYLVPYRPMHWLSLFQMNRSLPKEAQSVKYFAAEEFTLFDRGQDTARLWHSPLRDGSSALRDPSGARQNKEKHRSRYGSSDPSTTTRNEISVANKISHKGCRRRVIDVFGRADLLKFTITDDRNLIRHPQCFFLVMRDQDRCRTQVAQEFRATSRRICGRRSGSSPLKGSSSRTTRGRGARARASATRCCWPPDNSCG